MENGKKTHAWISNRYEYLKSGKHWYRFRLRTSLSQANSLGRALQGSPNVITANQEFLKSTRIKKSGQYYLLTLRNNPAANAAMTRTMLQVVQSLNAGQPVQSLQITNFQMREKVKRHVLRISKVNSTMKMRINGANCDASSVMDRVGKYAHLKVPKSVTRHAIKVR